MADARFVRSIAIRNVLGLRSSCCFDRMDACRVSSFEYDAVEPDHEQYCRCAERRKEGERTRLILQEKEN